MTTTAYDCDNNLVASDTRWSAKLDLIDGAYILYADDTGFNKISHRPGGAIFALAMGKPLRNLSNGGWLSRLTQRTYQHFRRTCSIPFLLW